MSGSPPGRDPEDITGGGDRYDALLEVLKQQRRQGVEDRERERRSRIRRERRTSVWVVALLAVIAGWLWLAPPSILRVRDPAPRPLAQEEAALRFSMYVQAQAIESFRLREGNLPDALEEAGPPLAGMEYVKLTDALYQLTGKTERVVLTYRSDLPLREFVGSGAEVLDDRPPE